MSAYHFVVTNIDTGQLRAHALVCPERSYAALRWRTSISLQRRAVPVKRWPSVHADAALGWTEGLVSRGSATMDALLDRHRLGNLHVQLKAVSPLPFDPSAAAVDQLDAFLWAQPFA